MSPRPPKLSPRPPKLLNEHAFKCVIESSLRYLALKTEHGVHGNYRTIFNERSMWARVLFFYECERTLLLHSCRLPSFHSNVRHHKTTVYPQGSSPFFLLRAYCKRASSLQQRSLPREEFTTFCAISNADQHLRHVEFARALLLFLLLVASRQEALESKRRETAQLQGHLAMTQQLEWPARCAMLSEGLSLGLWACFGGFFLFFLSSVFQ